MISYFLLTFLTAVVGAPTASPLGVWLVDDRTAKITIRPCGTNLCGVVSWSKDGGNLGKMILIDMKPEPQRWTGTILDPRSDTKYLSHIALQDDGTLKVEGCALGGLLCGGQVWTRTEDVVTEVPPPAAPAPAPSRKGH